MHEYIVKYKAKKRDNFVNIWKDNIKAKNAEEAIEKVKKECRMHYESFELISVNLNEEYDVVMGEFLKLDTEEVYDGNYAYDHIKAAIVISELSKENEEDLDYEDIVLLADRCVRLHRVNFCINDGYTEQINGKLNEIALEIIQGDEELYATQDYNEEGYIQAYVERIYDDIVDEYKKVNKKL